MKMPLEMLGRVSLFWYFHFVCVFGNMGGPGVGLNQHRNIFFIKVSCEGSVGVRATEWYEFIKEVKSHTIYCKLECKC